MRKQDAVEQGCVSESARVCMPGGDKEGTRTQLSHTCGTLPGAHLLIGLDGLADVPRSVLSAAQQRERLRAQRRRRVRPRASQRHARQLPRLGACGGTGERARGRGGVAGEARRRSTRKGRKEGAGTRDGGPGGGAYGSREGRRAQHGPRLQACSSWGGPRPEHTGPPRSLPMPAAPSAPLSRVYPSLLPLALPACRHTPSQPACPPTPTPTLPQSAAALGPLLPFGANTHPPCRGTPAAGRSEPVAPGQRGCLGRPAPSSTHSTAGQARRGALRALLAERLRAGRAACAAALNRERASWRHTARHSAARQRRHGAARRELCADSWAVEKQAG